jgi:IS5 family transposase
MLGKSPNQSTPQTDLFRPLLCSFIDTRNALVQLGSRLDWAGLESSLSCFYAAKGAPSKPVRLMAGLLLLKQMFNRSDEAIVEEWRQNPYYQYFTGQAHFQWEAPCDPSDLVHFRKRIGEQGAERIFAMSLEPHREKLEQATEVIADTTVQEKNITFPTDTKLRLKSIQRLLAVARQQGIRLRQTFAKELKGLRLALRFSHHPRRRKQARRAQSRIRTIAGILLREVGSKLGKDGRALHGALLGLVARVLAQTRHSKDKVYSLHEPEVACIAKGKAHSPYEFGCKVSVTTLPGSNVVVDMSHFGGNPHDSRTLETVVPKVKRLVPKVLAVIADRGYKGVGDVQGVEVVVPNPKKDGRLDQQGRDQKSRRCRARAAVEPVIGHLKSDHRMLRNFLKGAIGDKLNLVLAGAAFNLRKALNEIKALVLFFISKSSTAKPEKFRFWVLFLKN